MFFELRQYQILPASATSGSNSWRKWSCPTNWQRAWSSWAASSARRMTTCMSGFAASRARSSTRRSTRRTTRRALRDQPAASGAGDARQHGRHAHRGDAEIGDAVAARQRLSRTGCRGGRRWGHTECGSAAARGGGRGRVHALWLDAPLLTDEAALDTLLANDLTLRSPLAGSGHDSIRDADPLGKANQRVWLVYYGCPRVAVRARVWQRR